MAFLDESGSHEYKTLRERTKKVGNRYFVPLEGSNLSSLTLIFVLVKLSDYINKVIPSIIQWKYKTFKYGESVILHFADMKSHKNGFEKIDTPEKLEHVVSSFAEVISKLPIEFIVLSIDKVEMLNKYSRPAHPYLFASEIFLQRMGYIVEQHKIPKIRVLFESRNKGADTILKKRWVESIKNPSNKNYNIEDLKKAQKAEWHFHRASKQKNIIGLQIADMFATALARKSEEYFYNKVSRSPFKKSLDILYKCATGKIANKYEGNHVFFPKK
ncbi:DUF3800 domain-containing protein [Mesoaciditoga lauensis]|uniref:DUF3800 domain-containing protein n=1 Tax=Mesoaciditoga lauensis TaxID=1495039 RepID=UPI0012E04CE8|nr:DUF3800 domain-containing protein [Mesoaciditoga lauensis]